MRKQITDVVLGKYTFRGSTFNLLICITGVIIFASIQYGQATIPIRAERPIIGVLTQSVTDKLIHKYFPYSKNKSYIATSYVKYLQSAGARVVPIMDTYDERNLSSIFKSVNGILFPGGDVNLVNSRYLKAGKKLFEMAVKFNEEGGYFPLFGICLGFEALHVFVEGKSHFLSKFNAENMSLPVKFDKTYRTSRLFYNMSKGLTKVMRKQAITSNFHSDGIHPSWYKRSKKLAKDFRILATSLDKDGKPFVAAMEGLRYPFYGLQFHPEKPAFEWHPTLDIMHTSDAVKIGQHFANFFVDEARKNDNKFRSYEEELGYLIDRYPPTYTAFNINSTMPFDGIYMF